VSVKHYNQNNETTMNRKLVLDLSPKELELLMTGVLREKHAQLDKVCAWSADRNRRPQSTASVTRSM
jgi:hypothetical protein